ncbi:MAG: FAD-binding and (Fe-S)-binding domain-containing protein [Myxococcota bacterium]
MAGALSDEALRAALEACIPASRVSTRPFDRIAHAADASFYRLVPRAVVRPVDLWEVRALFGASCKTGVPLTFRAAGTSLSGQAVTDGILVDLSRHWKKVRVFHDGARVGLEPGVIGSHANAVLQRHGRRIGPDPASIDACMVGGIVANNASGMCCGVKENAYHTLCSLTCVLPNGLVLDTGARDAADVLRKGAPEVAEGLETLGRRVTADAALRERIAAKYRLKNTTGYGLNALIDFDRPHDMLAHLLVGSEGTLAFLGEVVFDTLPELAFKSTTLLLFESVHDAVAAVGTLRDAGARAIELMDAASLRTAPDLPALAGRGATLPSTAVALLVEVQADTDQGRERDTRNIERVLESLPLLQPAHLTNDPGDRAALWKVRKGLYPSIGAARRRGAAVIIEDVAFPLPRLGQAVLDLQHLFAEHGYGDAIIFGHAKEGNLHFVLTQSFDEPSEVKRYGAFMQDLVALVVRHDGSLKAEHGTGRNMAPFVETEWGSEAAEVMRSIKALVDPDGILNPGVIFNEDSACHLADLKPLPVVDDEVDRCVECGFCERACPSRDLTTTPRQRIVLRRELARLRASGEDPSLLAALERDYEHDAVETCATDGLCALACPVGIDTGQLIKRLRAEGATPRARETALFVAQHMAALEAGLRAAVQVAHTVGDRVGDAPLERLSVLAQRFSPAPLPKWSGAIPRPAPWPLQEGQADDADMVFFPSCVSRVMGLPDKESSRSPAEVVLALARRAELRLWVPPNAAGHCCSMPFQSKGYVDAQRWVADRMIDALWEWTRAGKLPVVLDASSCVYTLRELGPSLDPVQRTKWEAMQLLDVVELFHGRILERLRLEPVEGAVVMAVNCSARKLGLGEALLSIGQRCARRADVPMTLRCCGAAGDRGLLYPELPVAALAPMREELAGREYMGYYGCNPTCEMGMRAATGLPFRSFVYLVDEAAK